MIEFVTKDGESATINFGSADSPNTLRGEGYDRMFRDESAFIIKENVEMALRPLIYDTGGPVWETTTPWGKNAFWERWMKAKADTDGDTGIFRYNYLDNPYLSAEGVKEIEKDIEEYGEDDIFVQTEIYGNFVEDVDLYFNLELIDSCISEHTMINVELYN